MNILTSLIALMGQGDKVDALDRRAASLKAWKITYRWEGERTAYIEFIHAASAEDAKRRFNRSINLNPDVKMKRCTVLGVTRYPALD